MENINKVFGLNNIAHIELMLDDVKEIFLKDTEGLTI